MQSSSLSFGSRATLRRPICFSQFPHPICVEAQAGGLSLGGHGGSGRRKTGLNTARRHWLVAHELVPVCGQFRIDCPRRQLNAAAVHVSSAEGNCGRCYTHTPIRGSFHMVWQKMSTKSWYDIAEHTTTSSFSGLDRESRFSWWSLLAVFFSGFSSRMFLNNCQRSLAWPLQVSQARMTATAHWLARGLVAFNHLSSNHLCNSSSPCPRPLLCILGLSCARQQDCQVSQADA